MKVQKNVSASASSIRLVYGIFYGATNAFAHLLGVEMAEILEVQKCLIALNLKELLAVRWDDSAKNNERVWLVY